MIGLLGWIFIVALCVFLVACGALMSSLMNRKLLREIGVDVAQAKRDAAHAKNNAKATREAVDILVERKKL